MPNLSFTTQGAFPSVGGLFSKPAVNALKASTPAANALNNMSYGMPVYRPTTPPPPTPAPSTPVKSTTVNNADGSSHTTTYHDPEKNTSGVLAQQTLPSQTEEKQQPSSAVSASNQTYTGADGRTYKQGGGTFNPPVPSTTFPGITGGLLGAGATSAGTGSQYAQDVERLGLGSLPVGEQAAKIAADYGQRIADVGGQGARFEAGQLTTGTSPVAEGNAAVTAQTTAAQQQALATGEEAALAGTSQQLTAQQQAANAANQAGGVALTGTGQNIGALENAGTLAKPELGAIGQVPFSPTDLSQGSPLGAPGGTAADAARVAGQFAGAQAAAAAPGQTQAQNIITGGTSVVGANASGLADSIKQETALNTAASNATALADQVKKAMQNSGLNLTNSTDANTAINNLQSRLGSAAYTQLNIAVNDARNAYASILTSAGSTPTDADAKANQNINANMSPNQILGAIDQLNQGVTARQKSQHQQTLQYQQQLNGSNSSGSTGDTGGTVHTPYGAINPNL